MRSVLGWVQASHPFPLLAVVSLTGLIGVASAGFDDPNLRRLPWILGAMLLAQLSIGWANDYHDRQEDATHQPWKPLPSGLVQVGALRVVMLATYLAAVTVSAALGPGPLVCLMVGLNAGQAYNLRLKATQWSWLPFVVAFCVLPPFVWTGLGVWDGAFAALYPIALPLTVAAHLANALPDLETDREAGRGSVVVRLGRKTTLRALALLLVLPVALVGASTVFVAYEGVVLIATLLLYASLLAFACFAYGVGGGKRANDVWGFRLVVAASLLFTTGWLASVK